MYSHWSSTLILLLSSTTAISTVVSSSAVLKCIQKSVLENCNICRLQKSIITHTPEVLKSNLAIKRLTSQKFKNIFVPYAEIRINRQKRSECTSAYKN